MDVGSVTSLHDLHDTPLPTPPVEKKAITLKRLSYVFGFLYSLFLVILGILISARGVFHFDIWSPLLNLYIISSGLIILCTLIIDVKLFTRKIRKQVERIRDKEELFELECLRQFDTNNGDEEASRDSGDHAVAAGFIPHEEKLEHIDHKYCFSSGRHAGSVYLKFGAAVFALGHFVHTVLVVVLVQISIIMTSGSDCMHVMLYKQILESIYCFVQLYFIFNYSNLIIIKYATLARVAFIHIIAGNISLWISAVTTETELELRAYLWAQNQKNTTNTTIPTMSENCRPDENVSKILDIYSAYLFPFTVEFYFLTVGILFMIWRSIEKCRHSTEEAREFQHSLYAHTNVSGEVNSPHHLDIHISCRNAMGGLISSLFAVVVLIVAIILGFVFATMGDERLETIGDTIGDSMYLLFHITLLVATVWAFYKTYNLDINKHPVPWLDDVLLYICVPAFFLETLLTVVALIYITNVVKMIDTIVMSLQMVIQTAFIIDGLRRCSNSRRLRRTKPGRELVLFLLVSNVCMWFMYSFSYKPAESLDERYVFYGEYVWLAVGHLCTPIIMFYRFHSSVCIADIWSYAYKPGIEDH